MAHGREAHKAYRTPKCTDWWHLTCYNPCDDPDHHKTKPLRLLRCLQAAARSNPHSPRAFLHSSIIAVRMKRNRHCAPSARSYVHGGLPTCTSGCPSRRMHSTSSSSTVTTPSNKTSSSLHSNKRPTATLATCRRLAMAATPRP